MPFSSVRRTSPPGHTRVVVAVALALLASGGVHAQNQSPAGAVGDLFRSIGNAVGTLMPQQNTGPLPAASSALATAPVSARPVVLTGNIGVLFAKGTVNGEELVGTLRAIRQEMTARKSAKGWAVVATAMQGSIAALQSGGGNLEQALAQLSSKVVMDMLKAQVGDIAMKALDDHLQTMLDDRAAWRRETITLPSAAGLNQEQATRVVTLATLTVAARVTGQIVDKAHKDFDGLKTDYTKLLKQRGDAAQLLFDALAERQKAMQSGAAVDEGLRSALSEADFKFIDSDIGRLSVREFAKDLAAQNLALAYLGKKDPAAYRNYQTQADAYVVQGRAYLRTISGAVAFGGLIMTFGQTMEEVAREKQAGSLLTSMPLGFEFIRAAVPVAAEMGRASLRGVVLEPVSNFPIDLPWGSKAFVLVAPEGKTTSGSSGDMFKELAKSDGGTALQEALFRREENGLLAGVLKCDAGEAGRMLDAVISKQQRSRFATDFLGDAQGDDFSYGNTLELRDRTAVEVARRMLLQDHRRTSDIVDPRRREAVHGAQTEVSTNYVNWNDEQLMRLIFANRDGVQAHHATLMLGSVGVRPEPSMQAIYAYEALADACRRDSFVSAGADRPAASTKPRPKTNQTSK